jgi:hypothetical protein
MGASKKGVFFHQSLGRMEAGDSSYFFFQKEKKERKEKKKRKKKKGEGRGSYLAHFPFFPLSLLFFWMVNSERESRERSRHSTGDIFLYITQVFFLFYVNGPSSVAALFGVCSHLLLLGRRRISFLPVYFTVLASSVYVLLNLPRGLSSRESFNLTESTILALRSLLVFGNVIHVLLDFVVCPLHNCGTPIRPTGPCKNVGQIIVPLQDYDVSCYVRVFYPAKFSSSVPPCPQPYWLHGLATASGLSHSYASVFMPPA